jgi:hypothetical protein
MLRTTLIDSCGEDNGQLHLLTLIDSCVHLDDISCQKP